MGVFTVGRQVALEIDMPGWWLANASVDMDFRRGLYYDSSTANPRAATDFLSCTRASTGYARDSSGIWISFASNQLRITDLGLLVEDARTNNLLNSAAPATQTTASLATGDYTLWVEGSGSALASAGSATITGAAPATANNPDTFTVTVAGTVTVTVTGSLTRFQLELGSFPSSFILTTGAAATRAADSIIFIGNLDTLSAGTPGTLVVSTILNGFSGAGMANFVVGDVFNRSLWQTDGVNNDRGGANGYGVYGFVAQGSVGSWLAGIKCGQGWDRGGSSSSISAGGGTVQTSASTIWNPGAGQSYFGSSNGSSLWNGYLRRLTGWNSKLADATLQGFTV